MDEFDFSRFVADTSGLAALGTVAASLIGLRVPHRMSDVAIGLVGAVVGILLAVVLQLLRRRTDLGRLLTHLWTADQLFRAGILNEYEWQELRSIGLRKYD